MIKITTKIFYEQEKYNPISMEMGRSLCLEQSSFDDNTNLKTEHHITITNPHEFIGKILEIISMNDNKNIYKRIRDLEKGSEKNEKM